MVATGDAIGQACGYASGLRACATRMLASIAMRPAIAILSVCIIGMPACGGDDAPDTGTGAPSTTGTDPTTGPDPGTTASESSSTDAASSSTGADSSSSTAAADTTGGAPEDPSYPAPEGGVCPDQTAPIMLPGGSVCAPFCAGADAPCPAPASGDAVPECTPFAGKGGSGLPCTDDGDCTDAEACGTDDTCIAVAFWGCRLLCDGTTTCSDGMTCAGDACAYP